MKIKMMNILLALCVTAMMASCVDDLSTTGGEFVENDDTYSPAKLRNIMNEHEMKSVRFFTEGADEATGMAYNSSLDKHTLTTGASGMGVMNIVIGVERGWISREEGAEQVAKITRFLKSADKFDGSFAHWYSPQGKIIAFGNQNQAGEVVETAFMMGGLLTACEYFDGEAEVEKELRANTDELWNNINWSRFIKDGTLYWIWHQDEDRHELPLVGWNETLLVYILGMAAPQGHNIPVDVYKNCWQGHDFCHPGRETYGYELPLGTDTGGPLFLAQYSFLGLDPKKMEDNYCFYWQQNMNHTMINRHYCVYEAPADNGYDALNWGLTACGGVGDDSGYLSRDPENDDGVIAPTAALSSMPYTPFYSTQVLMNLESNYPKLNGKYGFYVAYRPATKEVSNEYLAMEHAPMAIMMENYRTGLIWNLLMNNEYVKKGLQLAGIAEPTRQAGFYTAAVNSRTGVCDMMRHPDRECYLIDYYSRIGGETSITLTTAGGEVVYAQNIHLNAGANVIEFFDPGVQRGTKYTLTVETNSIDVILR